jgi:hypothetical protein
MSSCVAELGKRELTGLEVEGVVEKPFGAGELLAALRGKEVLSS